MRKTSVGLISFVVAASVAHAQPTPTAEPAPAPAPEVEAPAATTSTPTLTPEVAPPDATPRAREAEVGKDANVENKKTKKSRKKGKLEVSGYIQVFFKQRYDTNNDNSTEPSLFRVQRLRLAFSGKLAKKISYSVDIDPRAPLITGVLRDAYVSFSVIPHHKIRVGQQKTLFGYENTISSTRLYVVNRAAVSDGLSRGVTLRDIGIGLIGKIPVNDQFQVEDMITVVNGAGMNVQADDTHRKNIWGRLGVRYDNLDARVVVRLGVSAAWGDQREQVDPAMPNLTRPVIQFTRLGGDLEIDQEYATVSAEYVRGTDTEADPNPLSGGGSSELTGYYVQIVGKLPHDIGPLVRYDVLEQFKRWTFGGFWGGPEKKLRGLVNYEIYKDELGNHDHKLYLWLQARF